MLNLFILEDSHVSGDTKFQVFSRLFPGKSNEIPAQFGFESVFVYDKDVNKKFGNDILKSES